MNNNKKIAKAMGAAATAAIASAAVASATTAANAADHPEDHFGIPPYLPDRPRRLAPCRGHAPNVTLRRP